MQDREYLDVDYTFVDSPTTYTVYTPSVNIFLIFAKLSREECCAHFYTYIYVCTYRIYNVLFFSFFLFFFYPFFPKRQYSVEYDDMKILRQGTGCFRRNFIDSWQIYKIEVDRCVERKWFSFSFWTFVDFSPFCGNSRI